MRKSRRTFLFITLAAAVAGASILTFAVPKGSPISTVSLMAPDPVEISIANSVTKQRWMQAAIDSFEAADIRTASGKPIEISISSVLSGESMLQISEGSLQPTVWSPGEDAWVDQLGERWGRNHSAPIVSAACAPTVLTPVGLAMWRPMAEALGWPAKPIGWKDLVDLANDPAGWASKGHPEWGELRLGHTHPQYSSAGLLFLASVIYAQLGSTSGLTTQQVYSPQVTQALATLAENTAKYGMVTTDLLNRMAQDGPEFLHVSSAFEEGTVRMNVERGDELRWPLAFIFPKEGSFWSDHPYCVLDKSGWVSAEQAEAANLFLEHLRSAEVQATAESFAIRPLSDSVALGAVLSVANGTDPNASRATVPPFSLPSPEVSEAIIDQFQTTKRKVTTMIVLDVSSSMKGEPINTATKATADFISRFHPQDRIGLMIFDSEIRALSGIRAVSQASEELRAQVLGLAASGGTNLNGAICAAAKTLRTASAADRRAGENRLYAIVLLSDGDDNIGQISEPRMFSECLGVGEEASSFKIFAIGFGGEAPDDVLIRMTQETHGALFKADPASIASTYLKLSAEQ
jgi:Ca-activated chloride channel family protein